MERFLLLLIVLGALARCYDITAPWKRKDHYNYGGVHSSLMTNCLAKTPLTESHGIPHEQCEDKPAGFYPNHPPTLLFAFQFWQKLWGSNAEWTYRSFVILFSWLNIWLVFLIARTLKPRSLFPFWAAAVQSLTMGGLYFASHADFICEVAVFFPLLASYLHLKSREHRAGLATVVGGLVSWPGFLFFGGQLGHHLLLKKKLWRLVLWMVIGGLAGLVLMMWLQQTMDLGEFLSRKIAKPGYVPSKWTGLAYVYEWIHTFFQYHGNYLSLFFLLCLSLELIAKTLNREWNRQTLALISLVAGGGLIYVILGHEYVYIHAFLYLYLFPLYSVLVAQWFDRCVSGGAERLRAHRGAVLFLTIWLIANYPFGRLQSHFLHDVINSLLMLGALGWFLVLFLNRQKTIDAKKVAGLLALVGIGNISQMINYRNEPAKDFEFCQKARAEYAATGKPVPSPLDQHFTRDFYCKGIPLIEPSEDKPLLETAPSETKPVEPVEPSQSSPEAVMPQEEKLKNVAEEVRPVVLLAPTAEILREEAKGHPDSPSVSLARFSITIAKRTALVKNSKEQAQILFGEFEDCLRENLPAQVHALCLVNAQRLAEAQKDLRARSELLQKNASPAAKKLLQRLL